jgi:hypothetical protein
MRTLTLGLTITALAMFAAPANAQGIYVGTSGLGAGPGVYYSVADSNDPYWRHRHHAYNHDRAWGYGSYAYAPAAAPGVYFDASGVAVTVGPRAYYRHMGWSDRWGHRQYGYWLATPLLHHYDNYALADCRTIIVRGYDGAGRRVRRC